MRRSGAATDCSPAAVEEADLRSVGVARRSDGGLRLVERPLAGENSAILVAVAVADHDLLDGPALGQGENFGAIGLVKGEAALRYRMGEERLDETSAALEVVKGLEERNDGESA